MWTILVLLAGVGQSTVMPSLSIAGISPNLVLLLTVSCAALGGPQRGVFVALVGGLTLDGLSGAPFGLATISLVAAALISAFSGRNIFQRAWFLPYLVIFVATIIYSGLYFGLSVLGGHLMLKFHHIWRFILPQMIMNFLTIPLVYNLLGRLWRRPAQLQDTW